MFGIHQKWNLMRSKCSFVWQAINGLRSCPAFRRLEDNHRPARAGRVVLVPGIALNLLDRRNCCVQGPGHQLVHQLWVIPFDEIRCPATATEILLEFLLFDPVQDGGIADFVTIQVEDRQHGSICDWVQEFVRLPSRRQRACFCFTITHDTGHNQVWIIKRGSERMTQRVSQLASFVNRSWCGWRHMAGDPARPGELHEKLPQAVFILGDVRIDFAPRSFQIDIADNGRSAVTWASDVEHIEVIFLDDSI